MLKTSYFGINVEEKISALTFSLILLFLLHLFVTFCQPLTKNQGDKQDYLLKKGNDLRENSSCVTSAGVKCLPKGLLKFLRNVSGSVTSRSPASRFISSSYLCL